ncbi:MAG: hypothetical protein OXG52_07040 [bacterium]|nr:hypothetical protein [bacterium]
MCDFAAGAIHRDALQVLLIEVKGGAADRGAIDQLQKGLDLIEANLVESSTLALPQALLVANRQTAQLKNLLRSNRVRLRFKSSKLQVRVQRCGTSVEVGG